MTFKRPALVLAFLATVPATALYAQAMTSDDAAQWLTDSGLTDVRFDEEDDGRFEFEASDADGRRLDVEVMPDGTVHSFDVENDTSATSVDLAALLLPEALAADIAGRGIVDLIEFEIDGNAYELEGYDADGNRVEIDLAR